MSALAHAPTFAARPFIPKNGLGPASRDPAGSRPATAFVLSGGASGRCKSECFGHSMNAASCPIS